MDIQPAIYDDIWAEKWKRTHDELAAAMSSTEHKSQLPPFPEVFASPPLGYRQRTRLGMCIDPRTGSRRLVSYVMWNNQESKTYFEADFSRWYAQPKSTWLTPQLRRVMAALLIYFNDEEKAVKVDARDMRGREGNEAEKESANGEAKAVAATAGPVTEAANMTFAATGFDRSWCRMVNFHGSSTSDLCLTLFVSKGDGENIALDTLEKVAHGILLAVSATGVSVRDRGDGPENPNHWSERVVAGRKSVNETILVRKLLPAPTSTNEGLACAASCTLQRNHCGDSRLGLGGVIKKLSLQQAPGSFSNPNPFACDATVSWLFDVASSICDSRSGDLLEYVT